MKLFLLLSGLAAVLALPAEPFGFYHDVVGIPKAARLKAFEESRDFDGRIVGGSAVNLGEYPHFGGLIISLTSGLASLCGSSMLSNTKFLTAAHCAWDGRNSAEEFTVVLGSLRLFSGGTRVTTNQVEVHGNWNPWTVSNDIAIITTPWIDYSAIINRINLPSGSQLSNDFANTWTIAVGYGRTADSSPITANQVLSHVQLPVITNEECRATFGNVVIRSNVCTSGAGGRSICTGDSGAPLQIGGPVLIGVGSFISARGCESGFPAVFTRVTEYVDWIQPRL